MPFNLKSLRTTLAFASWVLLIAFVGTLVANPEANYTYLVLSIVFQGVEYFFFHEKIREEQISFVRRVLKNLLSERGHPFGGDFFCFLITRS